MQASLDRLHLLAELYGIKTAYLDMNERLRPASTDSLLAVLKAMGAPVSTLQDVPSALREKRLQLWQRPLEPVTVFRNSGILTIDLRLLAGSADIPMTAALLMENGETKTLYWRGEDASIIKSCNVEGRKYVTLRLYLPEQLPPGYHTLKMDLKGQIAESLIISAPSRAYSPTETSEKIWGVFLPLYALYSRGSWGAGDFSDMETLMMWISEMGGQMLATLPLLASFFDVKFGSTPYVPASRLFWNEFYLDLERIPEFHESSAAQSLFHSDSFQKEISALRNATTVDYQCQLSLKRKIMEELAEYLYNEKPERFSDLQRYIESDNRIEDYARFRAAGEQHGICWRDWPKRMQDGELREGDYSETIKRYHLYAQWLAQEQIRDLSGKARKNNLFLYMDLPVGVHPCSYDVWRERDSFVTGVNGGAPPDPVFTSGQSWNFPPLHPENMRNNGYRYIIDCLQCQLKHAGMLRIDHMMNFHRLFWIPQGMENREGVYVGYRADELYAILTLESYRHRSVVIGEDLGMVPPEVRPAMASHGIYRMFVGQYELIAENALGKIPAHAVASLNTHDMYPFAAFWEEKDIAERQKIKLVDKGEAQKEAKQRRQMKSALLKMYQEKGGRKDISPDTGAVLRTILNFLANSPAYAVLINLEDLWLEIQPQNVPGTQSDYNWSRKARYSFEEFSSLREVVDVLREIEMARKGAQVQP